MRDPQPELAEDRLALGRTAPRCPRRVWLARIRWTPYERPLRATSSSRATARFGGLVVAREQDVELVDHRHDAAAWPRRGGRRAGPTASVTPDCFITPARRFISRTSSREDGDAVLAVRLDADGPRVRHPGRVRVGRDELGERHALLEVEEVERQLVGRVPGGEAVQDVEQEHRLAGAGAAADQPVRRRVVEGQHRVAASGTPDDGPQPVMLDSCHSRSGTRSSKFSTPSDSARRAMWRRQLLDQPVGRRRVQHDGRVQAPPVGPERLPRRVADGERHRRGPTPAT